MKRIRGLLVEVEMKNYREKSNLKEESSFDNVFYKHNIFSFLIIF